VRILLIHQAFCGPDDPGGTRHYELGKRLVAAGDALDVVSSRFSYLTGAAKTVQTHLDGINLRFAPSLSGWPRNYAQRTLVFLSFAISAIFTSVGMETPDVVLGTSPPIFQALSAWIVAFLRRRPFVLEVRDLWAEFAIDLGILQNRVLIAIARRLETFLYRRAAHIVVNSPAYRGYLFAKGIPESKITVIPNGVDMALFRPKEDGAGFRKEFQLEGRLVVMYAGAVGFANGLDQLLEAADQLRHDPQIVFVIVGDGGEAPHLQRKAVSLRLENIRFIPAQPKHRMPELLAAADVCVAILRNVPMLRMTYPNKVFDYMAAERPTVLAIDGVIREVIEKSRGGLFVPPEDSRALAEAILKLRDSAGLRRSMGMNAREYAARHFNRDDQARDFAALMRRICRC
jgi:glycosyltransferase involved in cell wall biosynthesis